jgi:hypothetical protein
MRKGVIKREQQPKVEQKLSIKLVSCVGCQYLEDVGRGTGYCSHIQVKMLSPINVLKPCLYRENASQ